MLWRHAFRGGLPAVAVLLTLSPATETDDGFRKASAVRHVSTARCCAPVAESSPHNVTTVLRQPVPRPADPPRPRATPPPATAVIPVRVAGGAGQESGGVVTASQVRHRAVVPITIATGAGPLPPATRTLIAPDEAPWRGQDEDVAAAGEIDGRTARSALAATALGALAERTRPSRLLGDAASGPLLAGTLDGVWGLGQQAAMRLIVEGKAPGRRQIAKDAARIVAAAASQEVASLMADATRYGEDNGIAFLRNLEVTAEWYPGSRPSIEARTIDTLFESEALDHTVFLQASLRSDFEETTGNIGLGYRYLVPDSQWMLGINAFYDRAFPIGHERMSIGLEASRGDFTLFGNRYIALSDWTEKNAAFDERPLSGWDAGIAGQVPGIEDLKVALAAYRWEEETERDKTGLRFTADYAVGPALELGATVSADDRGEVRAGLRLSFQFGAAAFGDGETLPTAERDHRLDFVNRENRIHTEKREVPRNYAVQFLAADVTSSNQTSLAFALSGAPAQAHCSYEITSSNGGTPVTGSEQVESDPQSISGIDVSGLADGTLTLVTQVISKQGAVGPRVTTQIVKTTVGLTASTSTPSPNPTSASLIAFTIGFSQPVNDFDLADLAVTNGTASNLRSADNATWTVDVAPADQGLVALQVPAGAATSSGGAANTASNTTSVVYDSAGPAGYAVAFLANPITAAAFEIRNAELGSAYSFTISSAAGGTPVTGSGTIDATQQQVSGLDLSGLADGTLTLSVTLADALGNSGIPATATLVKDASGPVIVAITPPSAGDYDDL